MLLFSLAFRRGGTVTVLYPIYASTFIWAAIMAWAIYGQPIRPIHVAGMVLLIAGMVCMGWGNAATP
jgi:multidrug transporter EmrE-like cation transporter